jgi:hypothetical protein
MYRVGVLEFKTFDDVISYAWNDYKISFEEDLERMTEEMKREACKELNQYILMIEFEAHCAKHGGVA